MQEKIYNYYNEINQKFCDVIGNISAQMQRFQG